MVLTASMTVGLGGVETHSLDRGRVVRWVLKTKTLFGTMLASLSGPAKFMRIFNHEDY
jgi:hypothetical protein